MEDTAVIDANPALDSVLDSVLSTSDVTATTDSPVSDETTDQQVTDTPEQPTVQEDAPVEEETDATPEPQPADQVEEGITQEGKGYRVSPNRLQNFQAQSKYAEEVQQFAPSVEDARSHYEAASDFGHFQSDHMAAAYDPAAMNEVLNFLDGTAITDPSVRAAYRASFAKAAEAIPERLQKIDPAAYQRLQEKFFDPESVRSANPQLYQKVERQVATNLMKTLYQKAKSAGGRWVQDPTQGRVFQPNDPTSLRTAQWLNSHINGEHIADTDLNRIESPDPLASERAALDAEKAELAKMRTTSAEQQEQGYTQRWRNAEGVIQRNKDSGIDAHINKALEPAKGKFSEQQMNAFRTAIHKTVSDRLAADATWMRNHNIALRDIRLDAINRYRSGANVQELNGAIQAQVDDYLARAQRIVGREALALINAATADKVAQNQQTHQRAATAAGKRGTATAGVPSKQVNAKQIVGKTFDDAFEKAWGG